MCVFLKKKKKKKGFLNSPRNWEKQQTLKSPNNFKLPPLPLPLPLPLPMIREK